MTVKELIEDLQKMPLDYTVYHEGFHFDEQIDILHDWRELGSVRVVDLPVFSMLPGVYLKHC